MNYRHAFHAGNFADVMKHVVLARILLHLKGKERPFRLIDTHAGIGLYDLSGSEASRTGEWRGGVGLMEEPFTPAIEALLEPWRTVLGAVRRRFGSSAYPGSPEIARDMLRPGDRAILVEKHPDDAVLLAAGFAAARNFKVLQLDGWTALGSLIPPPERRGLVLIDPPFEQPDEMSRCAASLAKAVAKWPTGTFALWFPIKATSDADHLAERLAGTIQAPVLGLELLIDHPDGGRLAGSGLAVVNPPWTLAGEAALILPALAERLGRSARAESRVREIVAEGAARRPQVKGRSD